MSRFLAINFIFWPIFHFLLCGYSSTLLYIYNAFHENERSNRVSTRKSLDTLFLLNIWNEQCAFLWANGSMILSLLLNIMDVEVFIIVDFEWSSLFFIFYSSENMDKVESYHFQSVVLNCRWQSILISGDGEPSKATIIIIINVEKKWENTWNAHRKHTHTPTARKQKRISRAKKNRSLP